jgi:hypothetical protein
MVPPPPLRERRGALVGVGLGVAGWGAFQGLKRAPQIAEAGWGQGWIPELLRAWSRVTGGIPLPLFEAMVLLVLLRVLLPSASLSRWSLRLVQDLGLLTFGFYLLWGFHYARPGLEERLGVARAGEASVGELRAVSERAVEASNLLYRELHGTEDLGVPTPARSLEALRSGLEVGWQGAVDRWGLEPRWALSHGHPKAFLASGWMKRMGVAGLYFPFTGEALVLSDLPGVLRGKDVAHEMAHQRGVAREADANTLAYLVAREAPDPALRYAASVFLQTQWVGALAAADRAAAQDVVRGRFPGVQRDLEDLSEYWAAAQGPAREVTRRANDLMLRSHGIPDGVRSYQGSLWVLLALARREGIEAVLAAPLSTALP